MIEQDPKKKKRGLLSLPEKMGLDQTTEYNTPGPAKLGLRSDPESEPIGGETVGDKVKDRMTGRLSPYKGL